MTLIAPCAAVAQEAPAEGADEPEGSDESAQIGDAPEEPQPQYEAVIRATAPGDDDPQQTRLGRERLERSPAASVTEALEREAGLYAQVGSRGERTFRLRGFDQRQVFTVIDGVPAYFPYDGQLDLGKIPIELVEDVVILRGPSSLRYGPGGMAGTLSITTRAPGEGPVLATRFEGGRGDHFRLSGLHSYRAGRAAWLLGGGVESRRSFPLSSLFSPTPTEDGGAREQSDRLVRHALGRLRVDVGDDGWVEATAWHVSGEWGIPPSTVPGEARYWRMTDWRATVATVEHRWLPARGVALQEAVFLGLFDNLLDRFDDATYSTQENSDSFHSWYHDLSAGGWARLRWSLPRRVLLRLELGARYEQHRSEDGGGEGEEGVSRALILGAVQLEASLSSDFRLVAAIQTEGEAGLEAGGVAPSGDGMIALRYEPESRVPFSVGLSMARRSRIPSLRERFSDATGAAGERLPNPDLRPEVALHLGLDASVEPAPWLRLEATAFDAEVRDLIEQVYYDGFERFENVFRARLAGVEVGVQIAPRPWIDLELAYQYLYARSLSRAGEPGPLPGRPAHQARAGVRLRPIERLEVSTALRVVGPQRFTWSSAGSNWGVVGEADLSAPDIWGTLGAYVAWDARLEGEPLDGIRLWIQATNLLDANFQNRYGFPEPGWQLWVGTRLEI